MSGPAWVDGQPGGRIDPSDRGLLLGDGVFDTAAAFRGVVFAGERHLQRLTGQAAAIGIRVDPERVRSGWKAVLAGAEGEGLILRTTVTRGAAARGLWPASPPPPTLIVSAAPWSAEMLGRPVRLVTSGIVRNAGSPTSRLKSLNYLDNVLAAREAAEAGADDALLLNGAGRVACATIANVFAVRGDRLATPPAAEGVQPGIMRALVLEAAAGAGLRPEERPLLPAELLAADAVFLTNSVRFLMPVLSLDGQALGPHRAAVEAVTAALLAEVSSECGCDLRALPALAQHPAAP